MGKHHLEVPLLTVNFIVFVIFYVFNEAELSDSHLPLELLATFTSWSGPQSIQFMSDSRGEPCSPGRPSHTETLAAAPVQPRKKAGPC